VHTTTLDIFFPLFTSIHQGRAIDKIENLYTNFKKSV
jgi:hypothetical protein